MLYLMYLTPCLLEVTIETDYGEEWQLFIFHRPPSEEGKEGGDSPPTEVKDEERKQIFEKRQKLGKFSTYKVPQHCNVTQGCAFYSPNCLLPTVRTPPKELSAPFRPPPDDHPPAPLISRPPDLRHHRGGKEIPVINDKFIPPQVVRNQVSWEEI